MPEDPKALLDSVTDPELRAILTELGKTIARDTRVRAHAGKDVRVTRYTTRTNLCAECVRLEALEPTGRALSMAQPGTCFCDFHAELEGKRKKAREEAARAAEEKDNRHKRPPSPGGSGNVVPFKRPPEFPR